MKFNIGTPTKKPPVLVNTGGFNTFDKIAYFSKLSKISANLGSDGRFASA